jgi:hypothetical protein
MLVIFVQMASPLDVPPMPGHGARPVKPHPAHVNPQQDGAQCAFPIATFKSTWRGAHWYCAGCLAQLPPSAILTESQISETWDAVTTHPDDVPLTTYRFLNWLKTTCNIEASGVSAVIFLQHTATATLADTLARQMIWNGTGNPTETVAAIIASITSRQH